MIGQEPNQGQVLAMGTAVHLVISLGQPIVPDVIGMSLADANEAITAVDNFSIGTVTYAYSDTTPAGHVVGQSPPTGTRQPTGSSVDIVISLGMPIVPNVLGRPKEAAIADIERVYSLSATVSYQYHDTVSAGLVISQNPVGGTPVPIESARPLHW